MGCDIHIQVQGRLADGTWEFVRRPPYPVWRDDMSDEEHDRWFYGPTSQDYRMFAFLAGVRASHLPRVKPAFKGRGLPEDYTRPDEEWRSRLDEGDYDDEDLKAEEAASAAFLAGDFDIGDHSHTHATLAELRAADWPEVCREHGIYAWLASDEMLSFEQEYGGADNVRVIFGFDS